MKILAPIILDADNAKRPDIPEDIGYSMPDGVYAVDENVEVTILPAWENDERLSGYPVV